MKKPSEFAQNLCALIEAIPASEQQTAASIEACELSAKLSDWDAKTDDEKITAILAPYLEKMLAKDASFLTDIGLILSYEQGAVKSHIQTWIFCNRIQASTLSEILPAIEAFDPVKKAREEKLEKIESLKRELAALEPKEVA